MTLRRCACAAAAAVPFLLLLLSLCSFSVGCATELIVLICAAAAAVSAPSAYYKLQKWRVTLTPLRFALLCWRPFLHGTGCPCSLQRGFEEPAQRARSHIMALYCTSKSSLKPLSSHQLPESNVERIRGRESRFSDVAHLPSWIRD